MVEAYNRLRKDITFFDWDHKITVFKFKRHNMNIHNKTCNLECVKKGDVHEFIGPVKILLVDPPKNEYQRCKTKAAILTITSVLIGANTFSIIFFCLGFKLPKYINTHILLCGLGVSFVFEIYFGFSILYRYLLLLIRVYLV